MAKKLEDFIRENKEQFDREEPQEGHFERFEAKLNATTASRKSPMKTVWRVAAGIAIILGSSYFYFKGNSGELKAEGLALKDISPELAEVENFYTSQIDFATTQMEPFASDTTTYYDNMKMQFDLLEKEYNDLKIELELNYGDERVINSMIQNYRLRLRIIEQYLSQISQQHKSYNDEKIKS